jgi:8-oxo-dGTP pyrophosphatase MutT (NUDIX family)
MSDSSPAPALPSATVVLLRDAEQGLELLLLQRASRKGGREGAWVFPGGKVDAADGQAAEEDARTVARRAAVRETREEAGLRLEPDRLVPVSRWITPEIASRRFDTWFFCATLGLDARVKVDGEEIRRHRWLGPERALELHRAGELRLPPPTFVTVTWLSEFAQAETALAVLGRSPLITFRPRLCPVPEGGCMLYPGDAGYDDLDVERPGPRHRLWTLPSGFRYERQPG